MHSIRRKWLIGGVLASLCLAVSSSFAWLARNREGPTELLARAQADFQAGRFASAKLALDRLALLREPTPMDRLARAEVAQGSGHPDEALADLARIPGGDGLAPIARTMAGRIELKRGRVRAAESQFLAALAVAPGEIQAHRELAYVYNVQHRRAEFDRAMETLSGLNALSFEHLLHWGKTRNAVWNPKDDNEALKRFLAADPDDRQSRMTLADGYRQMGQLDLADETLAPLPDSDLDVLALRAQVALERGDRERTKRLLAGGPDDQPDLARVRGKLALAEGKPAEAARSLRIALASEPDDRATLFALATALRSSGDAERAKRYQEAARRHDALTPLIAGASAEAWAKDPKLAARLAVACEAAGRTAEARAWYRLAIARDPLDDVAQKGLYRLTRPVEAKHADSRNKPAA
ncbi:tetratricopeptide repeat protein [Isosphaeraceae bacterium EP7]